MTRYLYLAYKNNGFLIFSKENKALEYSRIIERISSESCYSDMIKVMRSNSFALKIADLIRVIIMLQKIIDRYSEKKDELK